MSPSHNERTLPKEIVVEDQREAIVDTTVVPVEQTDVHERVLQQLGQLKVHLEAQRQHLATTGRTLRQRFEQVRNWWKKEEQLETTVARMAIAADHLADKIRQASPEQVRQHLLKELSQLSENIEKIQLAGASVERFIQPEQQAEHEDLFLVEAAGAKKKWDDTLADKQGKLGKYGQDCVRSNPETGTITVADGMSSGVDSFEIARLSTRRAQEILDDIPLELCATEQEVKFFVQGHLDGILNEINALPPEAFGGTTLIVARYLEKFDAIVMIDIGDCEACAVAGSDVLPIKSVPETMKTPPHIAKVASNGFLVPEFVGIDTSSIVNVVSLREFRQAHAGESVQIILTTDGLKNTTGQNLEQLAIEIIAKGPKQFVADMGPEIILQAGDEETGTGQVKEVYSFADDTTIISMTIPVEVQPAVKQEVAA